MVIQIVIVNTIKRVFGFGNGIDRNPQKANDLITEQIGLTMRAVNKEFKQDALFLEIEREKLKLSLEFKDFKEKFEKGEFNTEEISVNWPTNSWLGSTESKPNNLLVVFGKKVCIWGGVFTVTVSLTGVSSIIDVGAASTNAGWVVLPNV